MFLFIIALSFQKIFSLCLGRLNLQKKAISIYTFGFYALNNYHCVMASQPTPPPNVPPPRNKGFIFGLIKGNQWVFISPKDKTGYFWGGPPWPGGGRLTNAEVSTSRRWFQRALGLEDHGSKGGGCTLERSEKIEYN